MTLSFTSTSGKKQGFRGTGTVSTIPPTTPIAPTLGSISNPSGTVRRVNIIVFPAGSSYLSVDYSNNGVTWNQILTISDLSATYFDYDTTTDTAWYFRARAVNSGGQSGLSNVVNGSSTGTGPGTGTITGTGFGTKTIVTPHFFQPFTTLANGATPLQAGFDTWINYGGEAVTNTDGVGGGSLRVDGHIGGNRMAHIGKILPNNNMECLVSLWQKIYGNSSTGGQIKSVRAGVNTGDGLSNYDSTQAKFYPSNWIYANGGPVYGGNSFQLQTRSVTTGPTNNFYTDSTGGGSSGVPLSSQIEINLQQWVYHEYYLKFNTIGNSDGAYRALTNGFQQHNRNALGNIKTVSTEYLTFVNPISGIDATDPDNYGYGMSRVYIDAGPECQARIFRINASTLAAATGRFMLRPTAWSDTSISYSDDTNVPSGYNWICVINSSGTSQVFSA